MSIITSLEELEALYGKPRETSLLKDISYLSDEYQRLIEVSPFMTLTTCNKDRLDCSPRGDIAGFVRVVDQNTLMFPDRHGNNRIDSLKNIVLDPRIALLFLIPGAGVTLRIMGTAKISIDNDLLTSFSVDHKPPRSVIIIHVEKAFFQCARSIMRSKIWSPESHVKAGDIPTPGDIYSSLSDTFDGREYDQEWVERANKTLW